MASKHLHRQNPGISRQIPTNPDIFGVQVLHLGMARSPLQCRPSAGGHPAEFHSEWLRNLCWPQWLSACLAPLPIQLQELSGKVHTRIQADRRRERACICLCVCVYKHTNICRQMPAHITHTCLIYCMNTYYTYYVYVACVWGCLFVCMCKHASVKLPMHMQVAT